MTNAFACVRMRVEVRRSARVVFYVCGLASYFRVCVWVFWRLPHQEEFYVLGRRSPSSCAQKISWAHSLKSYFFLSSRWENRYLQDNEDAFPNADKVFIDEKTNCLYTAPQRNRGGGGRDSTKRKESAAALGRKAAAKRAKKIKMRCVIQVDFWWHARTR